MIMQHRRWTDEDLKALVTDDGRMRCPDCNQMMKADRPHLYFSEAERVEITAAFECRCGMYLMVDSRLQRAFTNVVKKEAACAG